jgi:hypothetical protein
MRRCVEPEWLDELPATDGRALQSRRDLRRLNAVMRHARFIAGALGNYPVRRVVDLGAGDGRFLLEVARSLRANQSHVEAVMIDRLDLVEERTIDSFRTLGWSVAPMIGDVFEMLLKLLSEAGTAIVANLFLHHFSDEQLRDLLGLLAKKADLVIACEPRRAPMALAASRLVGLLGCNAVTRHDAVASVRAGFRDADLGSLWSHAGWSKKEGPLGLFSHGFVCRRLE